MAGPDTFPIVPMEELNAIELGSFSIETRKGLPSGMQMGFKFVDDDNASGDFKIRPELEHLPHDIDTCRNNRLVAVTEAVERSRFLLNFKHDLFASPLPNGWP